MAGSRAIRKPFEAVDFSVENEFFGLDSVALEAIDNDGGCHVERYT
jgi:hypothetical protein